MKVQLVHPSCLMYSKIYLRREPVGLELVAAAIRNAGHEVQLIVKTPKFEVEELSRVREEGAFLLDGAAFIQGRIRDEDRRAHRNRIQNSPNWQSTIMKPVARKRA